MNETFQLHRINAAWNLPGLLQRIRLRIHIAGHCWISQSDIQANEYGYAGLKCVPDMISVRAPLRLGEDMEIHVIAIGKMLEDGFPRVGVQRISAEAQFRLALEAIR